VQEHLEEVVQQHLEEQRLEVVTGTTPSPPQCRRQARLQLQQWSFQAKQWVQEIPRQDSSHPRRCNTWEALSSVQSPCSGGPVSSRRTGRQWQQWLRQPCTRLHAAS
jgi:hypothetical protein